MGFVVKIGKSGPGSIFVGCTPKSHKIEGVGSHFVDCDSHPELPEALSMQTIFKDRLEIHMGVSSDEATAQEPVKAKVAVPAPPTPSTPPKVNALTTESLKAANAEVTAPESFPAKGGK
jgi:hypothetical protein